jgi:two-component system nitrogen regulation sensor histidine kinase NtrY
MNRSKNFDSYSITSRVVQWLGRDAVAKWLQYIVVTMAVCSCVVTILIMRQTHGIGKTSDILPYLYVNVALLVLMAIFIVRRLASLWLEHKRGIRGTKLHIHLVMVLSLTSLLPAVGVSLFSTFFFNSTLKSLFTEPFKTTVNAATDIAENYIKESQKTIRVDGMMIAMQLKPLIATFLQNIDDLENALTQLSEQRGLTEALIYDCHLNMVARSHFTFSLAFESITQQDLEEAKNDGWKLFTSKDRVRALIQLDPISDTYLFIGKKVSEDVTKAMDKATGAVNAYAKLEMQQGDIQITFLAFFAIMVLVLILSSAWMGLSLANTLFAPIALLIEASHKISQGELGARISHKPLNNEMDNLIVAFNHMGEQLKKQTEELAFNQKKATWADIARKIAHEIKNPLTPIQLSAERLKRKYSTQIITDKDTFTNCVDTIIRQVQHIGDLVSEFSAFARMPEPKMQLEDIAKLCRQALELYIQAYPGISFEYSGLETFAYKCDHQQITQVLTNLLQNSVNVLQEHSVNNPQISLKLLQIEKHFYIIVEDNGSGFDKDNRKKLIEPYYTTREKGTGLGLAIVSKITMDHNGTVDFDDSDYLGGAKVVLSFPI